MSAKLLAFLSLVWSLFCSRLPGILLVFVAFVVLGLAGIGAWALTEARIPKERVKDTRDEEVGEDA